MKVLTIGERIKQCRTNLGLSVDELAELIGKNRATIYRYESSEILDLPTSILVPLSKALHTTPAYLMGWDTENSSPLLNLGEKLILLRNDYNYSQEQVAKKLGITKSAYCYYETNSKAPDITIIQKLSTIFNVPSDFLLELGIFRDWKKIYEKKELILHTLKNLLPKKVFYDDKILSDSMVLFITLLDSFLYKIEFKENDDIDIYYKLDPDMIKSYYNSQFFFNQKQLLIDNYEKMNTAAQNTLIKYSEFMVSQPENLRDDTIENKRK